MLALALILALVSLVLVEHTRRLYHYIRAGSAASVALRDACIAPDAWTRAHRELRESLNRLPRFTWRWLESPVPTTPPSAER